MASVPIKIGEGDAMVVRRGHDKSASPTASLDDRVPVPIAATGGPGAATPASSASASPAVSTPTVGAAMLAAGSAPVSPRAASHPVSPAQSQTHVPAANRVVAPTLPSVRSVPANKVDPAGVAAALPTDPSVGSTEKVAAVAKEDPKVVNAELEKTAAEQREMLGESTGGTIVEGVEDDQLWTLLRRFDMQINHVLSPPTATPATEPDLRMTNLPDVAFRSDTLKSNFERVFSVAGPNAMGFVREMARVTDWENERVRTGIYCGSYFIAWFFGYTSLVCGLFFAVLMGFPRTRRYLFPQPPSGEPPSATDPSNKHGDESLIGSTDGARHRSKAEQAEEQAFEARALFEAYAQTVVVGGRRGKDSNSAPGIKRLHEDEADADPIIRDEGGDAIGTRQSENAPGSADAVVGGQKVEAFDEDDKDKAAAIEVKRKRDEMVAKMCKGTETGLGGAADFVEILQNSLSPPAVYPDSFSRFKLAAAFVIVPALAFQFTPSWVWGRLITGSFGLALWARTPMIRAAKELMARIPNWKELLDLRNSLLSNTPTNAQLTLHLLRVAEDLNEPLPAPPAPPTEGAPEAALNDPTPVGGEAKPGTEGETSQTKKQGKKVKHLLGGAFKKASRKIAGFKGDVSVDNKTKKPASRFQEHLLDGKFGTDSPDAYACKLDGTAGHIIIDTPERRMAWLPLKSRTPKPENIWDCDDIVELQKDNVSVPRMAFGWLGGADVDSLGLSVRFALPGGDPVLISPKPPSGEKTAVEEEAEKNTFHFERVERRDPLFNRLIAIGPQRWDLL